jgi:hypothetical protein
MGQTHVAFGPRVGVGAIGRVWLFWREGVEEGEYADFWRESGPCLLAFENNVILGEDERKRAFLAD